MRPRRLAQAPALAGTGVPEGLEVSGVTLDSRAVRRGDVYAALPGAATHGARFADQAVAGGAVAVVTDAEGARLAGDLDVPVVVVPDPRARLGDLSAWVYHEPAQDLTLIGITGTNGKTTMSYLLAAGLTAAGDTTGVIGTIGIQVGDRELPSARTTPEAPDVHAALAVMVENGVSAVAMEVSSHALALDRVAGLVFDVAVFTNLSQDHLDFHDGMEDYFAAKASLFDPARSRHAVICIDDDWGRQLATGRRSVTYARHTAADWTLREVGDRGDGGWRGSACGPAGVEVEVASPLPGPFNQANVLGALAAGVAAGRPADRLAAGLASCPGVPGRMEPVGGAGFAAYVDYAHTPDAVARAIAAVRPSTTGQVLVVLGCGGDRDRRKRPIMGSVAARAADVLIVTDDNPRSEDPAMIRHAMLAGAAAESGATVLEIPDRRVAIGEAVAR
ncbi:MAG: UDP-N-acetylmuramoyl-L-alanyl-D-glutamate--2,6-diaminopimelate ligase, partial [Candidatus Nanopelagicales bacterium]